LKTGGLPFRTLPARLKLILWIAISRIISSYPDVFAKAQRIVKVKQQKSEQHADKSPRRVTVGG
jgi:hypothetical protein